MKSQNSVNTNLVKKLLDFMINSQNPSETLQFFDPGALFEKNQNGCFLAAEYLSQIFNQSEPKNSLHIINIFENRNQVFVIFNYKIRTKMFEKALLVSIKKGKITSLIEFDGTLPEVNV